MKVKRLPFFLVNFFYFLFLSSCMFCGFAALFWCRFENFGVSRKKCLVKFCRGCPALMAMSSWALLGVAPRWCHGELGSARGCPAPPLARSLTPLPPPPPPRRALASRVLTPRRSVSPPADKKKAGKFQPFKKLFGRRKKREPVSECEEPKLKPSHSFGNICSGASSSDEEASSGLR